MSAQVNGSNISLTRGDSLILTISIKKNGEDYQPVPGDVIRFALKESISDNLMPLIMKNVDIDTMSLTINPEDTKSLEYGTYFYDLELTTTDGYVDTFIGPARFKITEEVY